MGRLHGVNSSPHPRVELIVDGTASDGAYAVLGISLPGGLSVPRHVQRGQRAFAHLLEGAIEVREDDKAPVVVRRGPLVVHEGRPVALRVLQAARLVAVLVPAGAAKLLPAAADPDVLADDRAALLAAAGIRALPALAGP
jgi:hypothetical protein